MNVPTHDNSSILRIHCIPDRVVRAWDLKGSFCDFVSAAALGSPVELVEPALVAMEVECFPSQRAGIKFIEINSLSLSNSQHFTSSPFPTRVNSITYLSQMILSLGMTVKHVIACEAK